MSTMNLRVKTLIILVGLNNFVSAQSNQPNNSRIESQCPANCQLVNGLCYCGQPSQLTQANTPRIEYRCPENCKLVNGLCHCGQSSQLTQANTPRIEYKCPDASCKLINGLCYCGQSLQSPPLTPVNTRTEYRCPPNCQLINGLCYCGQSAQLPPITQVNTRTDYQYPSANCQLINGVSYCGQTQTVQASNCNQCTTAACSQNVNCAANSNCNQCSVPNVVYTPVSVPVPPTVVSVPVPPTVVSVPVPPTVVSVPAPPVPVAPIPVPIPQPPPPVIQPPIIYFAPPPPAPLPPPPPAPLPPTIVQAPPCPTPRETPCPPSAPIPKTEKTIHYLVHATPINNTIININNISHPIHLNNHNENNIHVYTSVTCPNGSIGMLIRKNNETTTECNNVKEDVPVVRKVVVHEVADSVENSNNFCCEVSTPRGCQIDERRDWRCGHRRYNYCGSFCGTRKKVYLQPRRVAYQGSVLYVPANIERGSRGCTGNYCQERDCNRCIESSTQHCSDYCTNYDCHHSDCGFIYQDDFCSNVGGRACQSYYKK